MHDVQTVLQIYGFRACKRNFYHGRVVLYFMLITLLVEIGKACTPHRITTPPLPPTHPPSTPLPPTHPHCGLLESCFATTVRVELFYPVSRVHACVLPHLRARALGAVFARWSGPRARALTKEGGLALRFRSCSRRGSGRAQSGSRRPALGLLRRMRVASSPSF